MSKKSIAINSSLGLALIVLSAYYFFSLADYPVIKSSGGKFEMKLPSEFRVIKTNLQISDLRFDLNIHFSDLKKSGIGVIWADALEGTPILLNQMSIEELTEGVLSKILPEMIAKRNCTEYFLPCTEYVYLLRPGEYARFICMNTTNRLYFVMAMGGERYIHSRKVDRSFRSFVIL